MPRKVALVGHCGADASYLRIAVRGAAADAAISMVDDETELNQLLDEGVDLILLNRQLDWGFTTTEGVELIQQLRAKHPALKVMLVSNYPEAQQSAIAAGALRGFGKRELGSVQVKEMLRAALV